MSRLTLAIVIGAAVVLLVVGLVIGSTILALLGLFGGIAVMAVAALASGGDWIRDASAGRFRRDGR